MKWLFYLSILALISFEAANVYFIMPMPGSQGIESLSLAYFLFSSRWIFRCVFALGILCSIKKAWIGSKILTPFALILVAATIYMTNFKMAADRMFLEATKLVMQNSTTNVIDDERLIIGIENNGEARAYPIQFLGYHHKVFDTINGSPILVTYCTVCRSGRVYQPVVNGKQETFRLVGMDHFNAMFEDQSTKSWWRQENGEAVAGPMKGASLPEWPSTQTSLKTWLQWYPASLIMQPDTTFQEAYDDESDFEKGRLKGKLTLYDTASWHDKSWVAGVVIGTQSKAYDWNELKSKGLIADVIQNQPIIILVSENNRNLIGLKRISAEQQLQMKGDSLTDGLHVYDLKGQAAQDSVKDLERMTVHQEYWHSWRTFHPNTMKYE